MSQAYTSVKTVWGAALEASRRPGNTFEAIDYSTINEVLNIEFGTPLPANAQPEVKYLMIGRGGHGVVTSGAGDALIDTKQHRINNAGLFEPLPWILRPVGSDLDSAERSLVRGRRLENHGGQDYFAYYLRVITTTSQVPLVEELTTDSAGGIIREAYVPTSAQLVARAVTLQNNVVNSASGKHLAVSTPFPVEITAADIAKIIEAVNIIHDGDTRYATISEMAVCSGVDQPVTSNAGGIGSVNYTEALAAQVYNFIGTNISLLQQQSGISLNFRIGTSLPYLT